MAKPSDDGIRFSDAEKAVLVHKLQLYFAEELKQDLGRFDAEFLLDFVTEEMGAHYYNRGLRDASAALSSRMDDLQDVLFQLERPTEIRK